MGPHCFTLVHSLQRRHSFFLLLLEQKTGARKLAGTFHKESLSRVTWDVDYTQRNDKEWQGILIQT